ncbi:hypothetical protein BH09MYX1_BH09MYX1_38060 [soil metagenome]
MLTLSGQLLARKYRVGVRLGVGGMGEVYEAIQEDLGRRVAVKVMSGPFANDADLLQRFQREARAVAALGHPHIVAVTDFQDNPGEPPFFVMERLVGESLGDRLERERSIDAMRIARIGEQVLSALAAAHEAGLVHRDVKPDNVFLCHTDTGDDLVKLLDFGVAKVAEEGGRLTTTGAIVGTLAYMAPEQARSETVDARADIYALGACMYHALVGRPPYEAPTAARLLAMLGNTEPPPIEALRPDIDPVLRGIVARAMARDPEQRYPTARNMMLQLSGWLRGDSTMLASAQPGHTPVAVRLNPDARPSGRPPSMDPGLTGAPTPFSARVPNTGPNVAGGGAGWSAPPPALPAGAGWSAPPPAHPPTPAPLPTADRYPTPAPVVHPQSGITAPPPKRSHAGLIVGAALALVGLSTLATAGYLVKTRAGGSELAFSAKVTSTSAPSTSVDLGALGASSAPGAATETAVPMPTVTMSTVVVGAPKPPTATGVVPQIKNAPAMGTSTGAGGQVELSKLMLAVSQAHQAGDGRACLDAFDKLEKDPSYTDPGGYQYMKANCLMMSGRCEDGRKLARAYWQSPRPATQQMGPVEIENAVGGSAQMYCPTAQLTPVERGRRAQMMIGKGQTNKDPAAIGRGADEMAAALHAYPQATEDDRRTATSYRYQLINAYANANRCNDARAYATQVCAQTNPKTIDQCADAHLGSGPCKTTQTP